MIHLSILLKYDPIRVQFVYKRPEITHLQIHALSQLNHLLIIKLRTPTKLRFIPHPVHEKLRLLRNTHHTNIIRIHLILSIPRRSPLRRPTHHLLLITRILPMTIHPLHLLTMSTHIVIARLKDTLLHQFNHLNSILSKH